MRIRLAVTLVIVSFILFVLQTALFGLLLELPRRHGPGSTCPKLHIAGRAVFHVRRHRRGIRTRLSRTSFRNSVTWRSAKICGLKTSEAVDAAVAGGASSCWVSTSLPKASRYLTLGTGRRTGKARTAECREGRSHRRCRRRGHCGDPGRGEASIGCTRSRETPERVAAIRARFKLPVMKVVSVADAADIASAAAYEGVADRLMFDAKPPKTMANALLWRQRHLLRLAPAEAAGPSACPGCRPAASPSLDRRIE